MITLSPRQPVLTFHPLAAYAIVGPQGGNGGPKDCDNRTRSTNHRGWVYIHAGRPTINLPRGWLPQGVEIPDQVPSSAIIGQAELIDCVVGYDSPWALKGMWQWVWGRREAFEIPIGIPGKQGWWYIFGGSK